MRKALVPEEQAVKGVLVSHASTKEERYKRKDYKGLPGLYPSFRALCSALRRSKEKVVLKFTPNLDQNWRYSDSPNL